VREVILIGLGSKARQGKNYVCNYWRETYPEIQTYALADELKKYCKEHHDELVDKFYLKNHLNMRIHPVSEIIGEPKEDPIYGYTKILQFYGTDVVRKSSPDYWVHRLNERIGAEGPDVAVITDIRFPNEAEYVKKNDGYLVEVIRKNADGTRYLDPGRDPNHPSETALDDYNWDFTIIAKSGDLDALKNKALGVLANILKDANKDGTTITVELPDSDYIVW
jgi:hypothetical protein